MKTFNNKVKGHGFMKRLFVLILMLLLLVPAASATDTKYEYQCSGWAREDIEIGIATGLDFGYYGGDYRLPITRGDFAINAASLVVFEFGSDLDRYLRITDYREQLNSREQCTDRYTSALGLAKQFGVLQGRGGDDWDTTSFISRQEAAVMLARTYRAYHDEVPDSLTQLSFSDQDAIADWALEDVQLMNHLGIMTGVNDKRFDPLGSYTIEQCLITLLRLHKNAPAKGPKQPNLFELTPREVVIAEHWDKDKLLFQFETEDYYIIISRRWISAGAVMGTMHSYINIITPDLSFSQYEVPIIEQSDYYQGASYQTPENIAISEDSTRLFYTATVYEDVYSTDREGNRETLLFAKGIYTVSMDLKTGQQTYTRTDLN